MFCRLWQLFDPGVGRAPLGPAERLAARHRAGCKACLERAVHAEALGTRLRRHAAALVPPLPAALAPGVARRIRELAAAPRVPSPVRRPWPVLRYAVAGVALALALVAAWHLRPVVGPPADARGAGGLRPTGLDGAVQSAAWSYVGLWQTWPTTAQDPLQLEGRRLAEDVRLAIETVTAGLPMLAAD